MKIKIIKKTPVPNRITGLAIGEEYEARHLPSGGLLPLNNPYQIINGNYSGVVVPRENCIVLSEEKTITEKEHNQVKYHYIAKLTNAVEEKKRAQQMVRDLTAQINNKNKEIEKLTFFLDCSSLALQVSCQAIETLKGNR